MRLIVAAVGHRMPGWVDAGFADYARRAPAAVRLELRAVKPAPRGAGTSLARLLELEAARLLAVLPERCVRIALDERGTALGSRELARRLALWRERSPDVAFVIGGADGLAERLKRAADFRWSLGPLTLPHGLARVVVAEQLYRALCLLHNHPYHRE
jgi:23S rRNA (pseudouridine1915-N3)-methyltransferase